MGSGLSLERSGSVFSKESLGHQVSSDSHEELMGVSLGIETAGLNLSLLPPSCVIFSQ